MGDNAEMTGNYRSPAVAALTSYKNLKIQLAHLGYDLRTIFPHIGLEKEIRGLFSILISDCLLAKRNDKTLKEVLQTLFWGRFFGHAKLHQFFALAKPRLYTDNSDKTN